MIKRSLRVSFIRSKKLFNIDDIDVVKILVSKKEPYGTKNSLKYFIGYNDNGVIRPLCIKLPLMTGCVKHIDSNKTMSFKVIDNKPLQKYTKIWERVSGLMNIIFDSEPVYGDNDIYIKAKWIRMEINFLKFNFQDKNVSNKNALYKSLSLTMLDFVIRVNKKYYPQTLLEACKCTIKKNKMENLINDDLDLISSDESNNESDNGFDNESDNDESNE